MAALKSGIVLAENETLVMEIEEELWSTSSNPIARFFGGIKKFLAKISGYKMHSFLVITDKRVVEVRSIIMCYCFAAGRTVKYVLPSSVKEIGYKRAATCGCCCPVFCLYYQGFTQDTEIKLKGVDEAGALKAVNAFYAAITRANA